MSDSDQPPQLAGLSDCFSNFEGTYCVRKLVEVIVSILFLIAACIISSIFIYKYHVARPIWLSSILTCLALSLIINIFFCFFNQTYWLYALQSYFYNMYYLLLASYICSAYVLKTRNEESSQPMKRLQMRLHQQNDKILTQRIIFYCIMGLFMAIYLAIFITSLVYEIQHQNQQYSANAPTLHYCEQIWYMVFNILCILLSIVVVIIMLKSQKEQYQKIIQYQKQEKADGNITSSDFEHSEKPFSSQSAKDLALPLVGKNVSNPFKNLWIWVSLNVASQIFNLVESGLYLQAIPPQCLIVVSNPSESNIVSLIFVFFTMYLGYGATLWYISLVKIIQQKTIIDRSVFYSQQIRAQGNIELFIPSREETISFV